MKPTLSAFLTTVMACVLLSVGIRSAVAQEHEERFCPSAIYLEGLGQGILYSINYDHRLTPHFGLRAGFTSWSIPLVFFTVSELKFTGFPIMANYLTGEGTSHLELGIGVVAARVSVQGQGTFLGAEFEAGKSVVLGTATLGYRAQPKDGGFVFRIGLTPLFTFSGVQLFGGLSLGHAF